MLFLFKQAKACFLLMPILGLNYLLVPIRPNKGTLLERIYDVILVIITSSQGSLISFLLCFTNSEVRAVIRRRVDQMFATRQARGVNRNHDHFQLNQMGLRGGLTKQGTYSSHC